MKAATFTDRLNACAAKLAFINDAFSQEQTDNFRFSEEGFHGIYLIITEVETEIRSITKET